ncbi:DUF2059 domain-containing protein [Sphingomonas sp. HITSZ_GF]|uniref:DUF2059 domain-containing protein n=1 Tax=Sphingomonas sp. HITSZ_GF TaxID=3037247 RepID=UPI00240D5972|nr:DUF2059 domain-containing protein [Sphingomonas sp. HITSZ_GF]
MLSAAALAPAVAHAAAPVAAPMPDANIDKLVALMAPEDAISRLAGKAFDAGMDQQLAADSQMKANFDANPGLREQVGGQLRSQFTAILIAALPSLRTQLGGILQQEMTAAEIVDTLTFFNSPTGQKVRTEVYETMGSAPGQSPQEVQQAAIASVMAKMTAEDYPALMAFGASPAAQKMGTLNPKISAASKAWAEKLVAENRDKMKAMAVKLTADYLARKGTK